MATLSRGGSRINRRASRRAVWSRLLKQLPAPWPGLTRPGGGRRQFAPRANGNPESAVTLRRLASLTVFASGSVTGHRSSYEGEFARSRCLVPDKRDNGVVATGASGRHAGQSEVGFLSR